ncbi:G/T mismatch-specific thymine DNA glycosylase-like [Venturia canescens]|uniref:G/T mismatch-specific thymine DNA glycosylase-like n=1 Tax=Venturia canescens TaxID=32260 RepID=UPI001C9CFC28|nr:G/T mismatch-specific thymine DNA glycosylase-like [Venturia canescens]
MSLALNKLKKRPPEELTVRSKKKVDRFDGLSEEEVQKCTLEDILEPNLDLVFVGINPSLMAAHRGRYYAGPGNHFYKLLHASGLVPRFVSFEEDRKLLSYKIGLTNIVARPTRSSADLKKHEIKEGSRTVREKLLIFEPKIAVFNGKCIYEVFADKTGKSDFNFGLQLEKVGETAVWVVPSSSARCAHFPRMTDKLHFYTALKKYLSFLKGEISEVNLAEFRFEGKCKQKAATTSIMWRRKNVSAFLGGGRVANKAALDVSEENIGALRGTEFVITEILTAAGDEENLESDKNSESVLGPNFSDDRTSSSVEETISRESTTELSTIPLPKESDRNFPRSRGRKLPNGFPSPRLATSGSHDSNGSTDFINVIKKRLAEKKTNPRGSEEKTLETAVKRHREGKKLKYENLGLKRAKKKLDSHTSACETLSEM